MQALRILLSDVVGLYRRYLVVASLTWLPCLCLVALPVLGNRVEVAVITGVLTLVFQGLLSIYGLSLEHRMATAGDRTWSVEVCGAELGAIADAECAAMRHRAAFYAANYLRQVVNAAQMVVNVLQRMTAVVPFVLFWLVVAGLLMDAATTVSMARKLWVFAQTYPEASARHVAEWLAVTMTSGAFLFGALRPSAFGFCNQFRADWEHALRRRLNLPSSETPTLYGLDGNDRSAADEMGEYKAFLQARLGLKAARTDAAAGAAR